jgi:hypothetical protein
MSGAASRRKGHETERMIARWLRDNGFPDACSTRSKLGSDGTRTPGDVDFHPLITLESKNVASSSWPTWCRQAAAEAPPGTVPVVVRRTRGVTDVGLWECRVMWPAWLLAAGDSPLPGARLKVDLYTWKVMPFADLVAAVRALDTEGAQ